MTRRLMAVGLVAAVLLAGCAGVGPGTGADDATTTTAPTATSDAGTTTDGGTTSEATTTTTTTATTTTQEPYSAPEPPNRPTETKGEGRIESVELVDTVEGSDGGYADFDLRVRANTTMEDVDPDWGDRLFTHYPALLLGACAQPEPRLDAQGRPLPTVYRISPGDVDDVQFRMLDAVNALRQASAAPPLQLDPRLTYEALDDIVERLAARDVPVLLAGMMAARNMGPDYVEAFDAIYPRLAETHDLVLYPFFLDGALQDPALMLPDGIHPNAAGVETMVERMLPTVIRFLEERVLDAG